MTVGIYIRVSTQEQAQEGYSIPAQKERLTAFCTAQGWNDFKFYIDEGVSAKDTNRPKLQLLLEHVKQGNISTILVYRLDRFTRKVKDLHKMLEFLEKNNCAFKSATEPYDTSTAMGKLFITIVAALAEWETDNLSERIKMALENKVSGGERVGNVPYGFDLSDDEKLVKNEKGDVVLDMINKIESGWSLNRVSDYLNITNSDRNWTPNAVLRILRNPALYGATRWTEKVYEDTHEGFITKNHFKKIQMILDDRGVHFRKEVDSTYLFQGVLVCPTCESVLSVNRYVRKRVDGSEYQGAVYRCRKCYEEKKSQYTSGENRFEEALMEYMRNIKFSDFEHVEEQDESVMIKDKMQQIEKKREKYQKAWAADLMTDKEFEKRMNETRSVYEELKSKLNNYNDSEKVDIDFMKKLILTFNESFSILTQEEKRDFVQRFIRKIHFQFIDQPPVRKRDKRGKPIIRIINIEIY